MAEIRAQRGMRARVGASVAADERGRRECLA